MVLKVTFLVIVKLEMKKNLLIENGSSTITQTGFVRITQRSTGRQKLWRFYQLAIYWLNNIINKKAIPFSLLPPVSLSVIRRYSILAHWEMSQSQASRSVTKSYLVIKNWIMSEFYNYLILQCLIFFLLVN